jgi:DNA-binding transcriptional MocR family regulator
MKDDNAEGRVIAMLRRAQADVGPGGRLPSVRAITAAERVSPVTVHRALRRLAADGSVVVRPGHGTFAATPPVGDQRQAAPDLDWQAVALGASRTDPSPLERLLHRAEPEALTLSWGYPADELQPRAALAHAVARAARRPGSWAAPEAQGLEPLRAWFAADIDRRLAARDVIVTPGGQAALMTVFTALGRPGEPVLVEAPTYFGALDAARAAGLVPIPVPSDQHGLRPDLAGRCVAQLGRPARLLPDRLREPARRRAVRRASRAGAGSARRGRCVPGRGRPVAGDGTRRSAEPSARRGRRARARRPRPLAHQGRGAGLRVAALCARGPAIARLRAARMAADLFVSPVLQEAALELVTSPGWLRHLERLRVGLRARRDALLTALTAELPHVAVDRPSGGLHLWARLPDGVDDLAVADAAQRAGVVVSPGRHWYPFPAEAPASYLRLSFGFAEPATLTEAVRRLRTAVDDVAAAGQEVGAAD